VRGRKQFVTIAGSPNHFRMEQLRAEGLALTGSLER